MADRDLADDDVTLPRAAVNKMIKEMIPNMRVSNDARELILNCCTEFIHLVSSEANEVCNRQMKKTISPEHILLALEGLGFSHYIEDVKSVLAECKTQAANKRRASTKLEHLGIPEEELLRQQQELFQQARIQQAQAEQEQFQQLQQAQALAMQQQQQQQQQQLQQAANPQATQQQLQPAVNPQATQQQLQPAANPQATQQQLQPAANPQATQQQLQAAANPQATQQQLQPAANPQATQPPSRPDQPSQPPPST